jgi:hypothetical protein
MPRRLLLLVAASWLSIALPAVTAAILASFVQAQALPDTSARIRGTAISSYNGRPIAGVMISAPRVAFREMDYDQIAVSDVAGVEVYRGWAPDCRRQARADWWRSGRARR